jgi:hypothetical protein
MEASALTAAERERFWSKVDRSGGPDACWPWKASTNGVGYGQFVARQCHFLAHRLAFELVVGPVSSGLFVLHSCDHRPCCNPAHLRPGTPAENTGDMMARGRRRGGSRPGEGNKEAKLTAAQVEQIRERYARGGVSQDALAVEFGVGQTQIWRIVNGVSWRAA